MAGGGAPAAAGGTTKIGRQRGEASRRSASTASGRPRGMTRPACLGGRPAADEVTAATTTGRYGGTTRVAAVVMAEMTAAAVAMAIRRAVARAASTGSGASSIPAPTLPCGQRRPLCRESRPTVASRVEALPLPSVGNGPRHRRRALPMQTAVGHQAVGTTHITVKDPALRPLCGRPPAAGTAMGRAARTRAARRQATRCLRQHGAAPSPPPIPTRVAASATLMAITTAVTTASTTASMTAVMTAVTTAATIASTAVADTTAAAPTHAETAAPKGRRRQMRPTAPRGGATITTHGWSCRTPVVATRV